MNSRKLHQAERVYYFLIHLFILSFIVKIVAVFIENNFLAAWSTLVGFMTLPFIFLTSVTTIYMSRKWRQEGNRITKEIGLESLTIMPGNFLNRKNVMEFEIHHKTGSLLQGLNKFKKDKKNVMEELNITLQEDYRKLSEWSNLQKEQNPKMTTIFHTTTHTAMIHIWKKNSKSQFYIKKMEFLFDPYAKMNWIQWIIACLSTTGRIRKKAKDWNSYCFYLNNDGCR